MTTALATQTSKTVPVQDVQLFSLGQRADTVGDDWSSCHLVSHWPFRTSPYAKGAVHTAVRVDATTCP